MASLRVTTWNVLHRVHGVNWNEAPIAAFPDERVRIAEIARTIAQWLASGVDVVCLQEVSGDQLAAVRAALADSAREGARLHVHTYPRVPRLRSPEPPPLEDATEHLVTVTRASAVRVDARTFEDDSGKGFLAVEVAGVTLIDTHVSFGARSAGQLAQLAALARAARGGAVVLGDFNAPPGDVQAALGDGASLADLAGQGPTRIATPEHPGRVIDHVAVFGGRAESASVADCGGLSDHRPVTATVLFP